MDQGYSGKMKDAFSTLFAPVKAFGPAGGTFTRDVPEAGILVNRRLSCDQIFRGVNNYGEKVKAARPFHGEQKVNPSTGKRVNKALPGLKTRRLTRFCILAFPHTSKVTMPQRVAGGPWLWVAHNWCKTQPIRKSRVFKEIPF